MSRSEALRDLYEALEMLDARQTGRGTDPGELVVDLRDPDPDTTVAGTLRHEIRTRLGADWDARHLRW